MNFWEVHQSQKFITYCTKISVSLCCWVGWVVHGLLLKTNEHGGGEMSWQAIWTLQTKLLLFIELCCICTFFLESRCHNQPSTQFLIPLAFFILLVYSLVTRLPIRCQDVGYVKDNMFREGERRYSTFAQAIAPIFPNCKIHASKSLQSSKSTAFCAASS